LSDNRSPVYDEGGVTIYRVSALGTCLRALWAHRQGLEPSGTPEWLQEKFDQGNVAEPIIIEMIEKQYGGVVTHKQDLVEIPVGKTAIIRGHPDGIYKQVLNNGLEIEGSKAVLECKALAKSTFEKFRRAIENDTLISDFPYYAAQISVLMEHYGLPALFAIGIKDEDGLVESIETFVLNDPPIKLKDLKVKIIKLERMAEMPKCDISVYPCPFFFLHDDKDVVLSEDAWLGMMAKAYFEAHAAGKKAEQTKKDTGDYIKKTMAEVAPDGDEVEVHDGDGNEWKVKMVNSRSGPKFDIEAAKKDGVEVDKYMKPGGAYSYPNIKPPKDYRLPEDPYEGLEHG